MAQRKRNPSNWPGYEWFDGNGDESNAKGRAYSSLLPASQTQPTADLSEKGLLKMADSIVFLARNLSAMKIDQYSPIIAPPFHRCRPYWLHRENVLFHHHGRAGRIVTGRDPENRFDLVQRHLDLDSRKPIRVDPVPRGGDEPEADYKHRKHCERNEPDQHFPTHGSLPCWPLVQSRPLNSTHTSSTG